MKVSLVGAGPGDPGLLTCKGRNLLAQADCVLYDNLANPSLLDFAPASAERIYVGKKRSNHPVAQEEICRLLVDKAREGKRVVRLKGGDPYIFGRGGEEAEALADAGIPFEVVPGVTASLGAAAYCGVPLTHREHTSAVTFVTGHSVESIDWERVGHVETLAILMGLTHVRQIAAELIRHGKPADTPAMAVRWATRPAQQTLVGTLADIADRVESSGMKPPALFIIGEVVRLRPKLNWFERLPLFGRRIAVTRARAQASELADLLEPLGADIIEFPVIEIAPPADPEPLARAIARLPEYDWIAFTSANGVRAFVDALDRSPSDWRSLRARIAAIGPGTRRELETLHLKVDLTPAEYVAESLVEAFAPFDMQGKRVLLPRAAVARDVLPNELTARGAQVDVVEAYRTIVPATSPELLPGNLDWITFTSSSTVKNFLALAGKEAIEGARIASIGPVTSETARRHGLKVEVEAADHTIPGLVEAILKAAI